MEQALYVGDNSGNLRVYQNKNGALSETAVINLGREKPVTYIKISAGSVVAYCDNLISTFLPFKPLKKIAEFKPDDGPISSVSRRYLPTYGLFHFFVGGLLRWNTRLWHSKHYSV